MNSNMKDSLQELLLFVPLYQQTFLTSLPKKHVYFESLTEQVPDQWLQTPTLLIIKDVEQYANLTESGKGDQLVQDPNFIGMIISIEISQPVQDDLINLFERCSLPIIHINDKTSLQVFYQNGKLLNSFSKVSLELIGLMEKGFTNVISEVAKAIESPFLYLDEHNQLLWQTGKEQDLRKINQWLNLNRREVENKTYSTFIVSTNEKNEELFTPYPINIAGIMTHTLVASAYLEDWQKKFVDKLVGLTALLLQTEEILQEQQEKMKEHFVYDLLYHKFESQKVMIKQAKTWGWNLEIPHHLIIISVEFQFELLTDANWMEEITTYIMGQASEMKETIIVFPFQDQLVLLIEDGAVRTFSERKDYVSNIANQIVENLVADYSQYQFFSGIGKWYQDTLFLNKSYQEAKLALQFGQTWFDNKNVYHIHDLGIIRLLIHIHQEILYDFSQEYLSPLLESDDENGTEYMNSLKLYIQYQGNINDVADALFVHHNTLRNRLKKIEEITGISLQDPEASMNLVSAVKIHSFMNL